MSIFTAEIRPVVDTVQLQQELNDAIGIAANCTLVEKDIYAVTGDNVTITWDADLTPDEIVIMNDIIANHVATNIIVNDFNMEIRPVNAKQLQLELNSTIGILSTCTSIDYLGTEIGDNVIIHWSEDLSELEIIKMNNTIDAHVAQSVDIVIDELPYSELGNKLGVHSSSKPSKPNKEFYLVWTGSGDDPITGNIGEGDILQFHMTPGTPSKTLDVAFNPLYGDTYIHEGYVKWDNGSYGDSVSAKIVATATPMQTTADLNYEIVDNWVIPASGGPGTGTHGFGGTPILIPRPFMKDGEYDYDEINGLTYNANNTGMYKISSIERVVHRYINKIPTFGNSYGFTRLTSDETAYLPPGYLIRVQVDNVSDTDWNLCVFFEVFRERTAVP